MTTRHVTASTVLAIGLAGLVAGCSSSGEGGGPKGSLAIALGATGAPAGVITIAGIEARLADRTWVPVERGLPADVDLDAMMNVGTGATLPAELLPAGDYDALELRITRVQVTQENRSRISIPAPERAWTARIPVSFSVVAGRSTVVNLALDCGSSISRVDGQFEFDPDFEVESVEHDR